MKNSATYRFIASLLSLSILIGISVPSGLHAMPEELCDEMQQMHHPQQPVNKHEVDCPMNGQLPVQSQNENAHHAAHNLGLVCACSVDEAPLNIQAPAQVKVKVPAVMAVETIAEIHIDEFEAKKYSIPASDVYSSPPIYLTNESFLN